MNEDEFQTPQNGTDDGQVTPQDDLGDLETPQTPIVDGQSDEQSDDQGNEQTPPQQPQVDYKQKFVESQREAILLNERNKQKEAQLNNLTSKDTPTDDELRQRYSWWDDPSVSNETKDFYKEQAARDKQLKATQSLAQTALQKLEFQEKLDDFIDEPPQEFKGLKGNEADFKRFAKKKENVGLPLNVLAKAFLFDVSDETPATHTPVKTPGLENGTGGPRQAPKPKKMSVEDASNLRKTNYEEYRKAVMAGKIEDEF